VVNRKGRVAAILEIQGNDPGPADVPARR